MRSLLLVTIGAIFALGLVMIFSTTSAEVLDLDLGRSTHQALIKQIGYALVGALLAFSIYTIGYHNLLRLSPILMVFFTILLILVLIPGIGKEVNGSKRWIQLAGLTLQPSEFVKYLAPLSLIYAFMERKRVEMTFKEFVIFLVPYTIPLGLILLEPNNGTVGVVGLSLTVVLLVTQVPLRYWAVPLVSLTLVGGVFAVNLPYVKARLKVYMNPELDLQGKGHQPHQAKIAAGSGGLFGKGPGNSWQKLSYLPEAQNDYIGAIYAEEFGFLGVMGLISLYMFLGFLGFSIANYAADPQGLYIGAVVTFLICFQAFLNLGVVSGILPSTGLNLPFFSQGGSSLIANLMGVGLLCSVARAARVEGIVASIDSIY